MKGYFPHEKDWVFDGELLLRNKDNLETKDLFRETSKILKNETVNKDNITFNMFDCVPLDEFLNGKSQHDYKYRRELMDRCYGAYWSYLDKLDVVIDGTIKLLYVIYKGKGLSVIPKLQHDYVDKYGWEGLMLNLADEKYKTKRNPDLLKIKKFFSSDVLIKAVYEGTGINRGRLGGIIVQFKDFEVQVGSGFSEDERIKYWNNPKLIIGKIAEINYFEETHNQKGGKGLRFPTWKTLRTDKTVNDVNYES